MKILQIKVDLPQFNLIFFLGISFIGILFYLLILLPMNSFLDVKENVS